MVQLNNVANQLRARLETVISKIKNKNHENERTHSSLSSSSASPNATNPENLNQQTVKVLDSVFNALFGVCSGNNCTNQSSDNDSQVITKTIQKKHLLDKDQRRTGMHSLKLTGSNLESRYAQHYQDDHGRAARATLMASEREEKEKMTRRKLWEQNSRLAHAEARGAAVEEKKRSRLSSSNRAAGGTGARRAPQHREHIEVNGNPLSLSEVHQQSSEDDLNSVTSYNYDDGISALSAHTLEEMAKAEAILRKRSHKEPQEQGFDISIEQTSSGPPSPTGTIESSTSEEDDRSNMDNLIGLQYDEDQFNQHSLGQQKKYPVQMARNNSESSRVSTNTSKSEFSTVWKNNEQQYWTQVVDSNFPSVGSVRANSITSTSQSNALLSQKSKKKGRPRLFGRRKKYMECEEEYDDQEYSI